MILIIIFIMTVNDTLSVMSVIAYRRNYSHGDKMER